MSMVLQSRVGGDFQPHPEGIHPAVCVDVIDLGLVETEFQGQRRMTNKVRLYFETEQRGSDGKNCVISKTFTASLHPKAKLADFLGKWRGKPVLPGEAIDLAKLVGANCTLVVSHQQNLTGRTYASIDAVSKPTKKLVPSGGYDPVLARQRIEDWKAREQGAKGELRGPSAGQPARAAVPTRAASAPAWIHDGAPSAVMSTVEREMERRATQAPAAVAPKSSAPTTAQPAAEFDPEVGF